MLVEMFLFNYIEVELQWLAGICDVVVPESIEHPTLDTTTAAKILHDQDVSQELFKTQPVIVIVSVPGFVELSSGLTVLIIFETGTVCSQSHAITIGAR
jgi:hypothetical protein